MKTPQVDLEGFREVSQDEFYKIISPLDVSVSTVGNRPYTTEFKLSYNNLIGKIVNSYEGEYLYPIISHYYINERYIK